MAGEENTIQNDRLEVRAALSSTITSPEAACLGYLGLALLAVSETPDVMTFPEPIRVVFGVGFVCFLPGYAVLAALYPARYESPGWFSLGGSGLAWRDRLALSGALSLGLLPLFGLGLAALGLGFETNTLVGTLTIVVLVSVAISGGRRLQLPADERHVVPYGRWLNVTRAAFAADRGRGARALDLLLFVVVVGSVLTLAGAVAAPPAGESYTDFHLLSENDEGGLVASGYPTDLVRGEEYQYVVDIDNHEGERTTYRVVAELQRVRTTDRDLTVLERQRVDQFETTIPPGESAREARPITPDIEGQNLRLVYYLYRGEPPSTPSTETAYRSVYVWVSVDAE